MLIVYNKKNLALAYADEKLNNLNDDVITLLKNIHGLDVEFDYIVKENLMFDKNITYEVINNNGVIDLKMNETPAPLQPPTPEERIEALELIIMDLLVL